MLPEARVARVKAAGMAPLRGGWKSRNPALRARIAGLGLDLAVLRLKHALGEIKYDPNQPRVPAGSSDGGQWTGTWEWEGEVGGVAARPSASGASGSFQIAGGFTDDQTSMTVQSFVSGYCRGGIRSVLPGQFLGMTINEVMAIAKTGNADARTCLKILREGRFRK